MLQCTWSSTSRPIAGQLLLATSLVYITPETDLLTHANWSWLMAWVTFPLMAYSTCCYFKLTVFIGVWYPMQVANWIIWFPVSQSAGIADRPGFGMTTLASQFAALTISELSEAGFTNLTLTTPDSETSARFWQPFQPVSRWYRRTLYRQTPDSSVRLLIASEPSHCLASSSPSARLWRVIVQQHNCPRVRPHVGMADKQ